MTKETLNPISHRWKNLKSITKQYEKYNKMKIFVTILIWFLHCKNAVILENLLIKITVLINMFHYKIKFR